MLSVTVTYRPTSQRVANLSDNLCRWKDRSAGHFESWLLTLNERVSGQGFRLRYALDSPLKLDERPAVGSLLAAAFDPRARQEPLCLIKELDLSLVEEKGSADSIIKLGEARLTPTLAEGALDDGRHSISWSLRFIPNQKTFHHIPRSLSQLAGVPSFICSPNLDTRFSGVVTLDGRETILEDEPGCQTHIWGRKQVDEWVWVHSNAFETHPGAVFEGLAAKSRMAGRILPQVQSLYLRIRDEEHHFVRLRTGEQWRHNLGIGFWTFSAMNTKVYIEGTAQCRFRNMVQVGYRDPDGEPLYCKNSEVAHLKIRLFRRVHGLRFRHVETLTAHSTAHLEHASRAPDPHVKIVTR